MSTNEVEQTEAGMREATKWQRSNARKRELKKKRLEDGLCETCGKPRGGTGTGTKCRPCADKQNARSEKMFRRRKDEGRCILCGELRGEEGTGTMCRHCADKLSACRSDKERSRFMEGLCLKCGGPRGEDGTERLCRPCAEKRNALQRRHKRRDVVKGICPSDGAVMHVLKRCPACLYEAGERQVDELSFTGLIPPPESGDKLEVCVWCDGCLRGYHRGQSYDKPHLRPIKYHDEHVGKEGEGLWLRYSQIDERGQIPVDYEKCSTPEKLCTKPVSKTTADSYMLAHRRGEVIPGICREHALNYRLYEEIVLARNRQQLVALAKAQNGDGGENGNGKVGHRPRAERDQWLFEAVGKIAARWIKVRNNEAPSRGHRLKQVRQEDVAKAIGITSDRLGTQLRECKLSSLFPDVRSPFRELVSFVAAGVDGGQSTEEIFSDLKLRGDRRAA